MQAIDFYFDFSSPYGYVAASRIEAIAAKHARAVTWRPYLMGAALKRTGRAPLVDYDLVSNYAKRDIARSARRDGITINMPSKFPVPSISACRAFYAISDSSAERAVNFAKATFAAYFVDDRAIQNRDVILDIADECGEDRDSIAAALNDPEVKERLRQVTDDAIAAGVFGSPFIIVDDEPFWGADRLEQIDQWLERGGW